MGDLGFVPDVASYLRKCFRVERLYALLPRFDLWDRPFAAWTAEDWRTCGLSALWDIAAGRVLWAEGARTVEEMGRVGVPFKELMGIKAWKRRQKL